MSEDEKKSLLKDLLNLSEVDGKLNNDEWVFILAIAKGIGISESDLLRIKDEDVPFIPPPTTFARIEHMHRMMLLMASDESFTDIEKDFLINIGLKLGIRPEAIKTLIIKLESSENHIIPPEEIIRVHRIYFN